MKFNETWIVIAIKDLYNYIKFKKIIKDELKDKTSKMNQYDIKINKFGNILYIQYNFADVDFMGADYNNELMVMRKLKPVIEYLNKDLNFGEYLKPDIYQFYDEDNEEPTLSYGITFEFVPFILTKKVIYKILGGIVILVGLICGIIKLIPFINAL